MTIDGPTPPRPAPSSPTRPDTPPRVMDYYAIKEILNDCEFEDWRFELSCQDLTGAFLMQIHFPAKDRDSGEVTEQKGRKWRISKHSTVSEVVQTAFFAVKTAMEHEVRENFRYKGKAPFNPHVSIEALMKASEHEDVRPPMQYAVTVEPANGEAVQGFHPAAKQL